MWLSLGNQIVHIFKLATYTVPGIKGLATKLVWGQNWANVCVYVRCLKLLGVQFSGTDVAIFHLLILTLLASNLLDEIDWHLTLSV